MTKDVCEDRDSSQPHVAEQLFSELKRSYYAGQRPSYERMKLIAPSLSSEDYKLLLRRFIEYMRDQELQLFREQTSRLSSQYPFMDSQVCEDLLFFEHELFGGFADFLLNRDRAVACSFSAELDRLKSEIDSLTAENSLLKKENRKLKVQIDALESSLSRLDESYQFECKAHQQSQLELSKLRENDNAGRILVRMLQKYLDNEGLDSLSRNTAKALTELLSRGCEIERSDPDRRSATDHESSSLSMNASDSLRPLFSDLSSLSRVLSGSSASDNDDKVDEDSLSNDEDSLQNESFNDLTAAADRLPEFTESGSGANEQAIRESLAEIDSADPFTEAADEHALSNIYEEENDLVSGADSLISKSSRLNALYYSMFDDNPVTVSTALMAVEQLIDESMQQGIFDIDEEKLCRRLAVRLIFTDRESLSAEDAAVSDEAVIAAVKNQDLKLLAVKALNACGIMPQSDNGGDEDFVAAAAEHDACSEEDNSVTGEHGDADAEQNKVSDSMLTDRDTDAVQDPVSKFKDEYGKISFEKNEESKEQNSPGDEGKSRFMSDIKYIFDRSGSSSSHITVNASSTAAPAAKVKEEGQGVVRRSLFENALTPENFRAEAAEHNEDYDSEDDVRAALRWLEEADDTEEFVSGNVRSTNEDDSDSLTEATITAYLDLEQTLSDQGHEQSVKAGTELSSQSSAKAGSEVVSAADRHEPVDSKQDADSEETDVAEFVSGNVISTGNIAQHKVTEDTADKDAVSTRQHESSLKEEKFAVSPSDDFKHEESKDSDSLQTETDLTAEVAEISAPVLPAAEADNDSISAGESGNETVTAEGSNSFRKESLADEIAGAEDHDESASISYQSEQDLSDIKSGLRQDQLSQEDKKQFDLLYELAVGQMLDREKAFNTAHTSGTDENGDKFDRLASCLSAVKELDEAGMLNSMLRDALTEKIREEYELNAADTQNGVSGGILLPTAEESIKNNSFLHTGKENESLSVAEGHSEEKEPMTATDSQAEEKELLSYGNENGSNIVDSADSTAVSADSDVGVVRKDTALHISADNTDTAVDNRTSDNKQGRVGQELSESAESCNDNTVMNSEDNVIIRSSQQSVIMQMSKTLSNAVSPSSDNRTSEGTSLNLSTENTILIRTPQEQSGGGVGNKKQDTYSERENILTLSDPIQVHNESEDQIADYDAPGNGTDSDMRDERSLLAAMNEQEETEYVPAEITFSSLDEPVNEETEHMFTGGAGGSSSFGMFSLLKEDLSLSVSEPEERKNVYGSSDADTKSAEQRKTEFTFSETDRNDTDGK